MSGTSSKLNDKIIPRYLTVSVNFRVTFSNEIVGEYLNTLVEQKQISCVLEELKTKP